MSRLVDSFDRRRLLTSYFSVTIGVTLMLFLLASFGLLVLSAKKIANHFKEQVTVTVQVKDNAKTADITQLQRTLPIADHTKEPKFTPKDKTAEKLSGDVGEDFVTSIDTDPLRNAIGLSLETGFVEPDKMQEIKYELEQDLFVSEIMYDQSLAALVHDNMNRIRLITLIFSALFTFVSVLLINASVRLSICSRRFIIKTMRLVGATRGSICRPSIRTNVRLEILSALVAMSFFYLSLLATARSYPEFGVLIDSSVLLIAFVGALLIGILIS